VHPKVVCKPLGHASIGITLDTYSHVMPGMQEEAAEKDDAGLRAALAEPGHVGLRLCVSEQRDGRSQMAVDATRVRVRSDFGGSG
jgi:hypothetical protein